MLPMRLARLCRQHGERDVLAGLRAAERVLEPAVEEVVVRLRVDGHERPVHVLRCRAQAGPVLFAQRLEHDDAPSQR